MRLCRNDTANNCRHFVTTNRQPAAPAKSNWWRPAERQVAGMRAQLASQLGLGRALQGPDDQMPYTGQCAKSALWPVRGRETTGWYSGGGGDGEEATEKICEQTRRARRPTTSATTNTITTTKMATKRLTSAKLVVFDFLKAVSLSLSHCVAISFIVSGALLPSISLTTTN